MTRWPAGSSIWHLRKRWNLGISKHFWSSKWSGSWVSPDYCFCSQTLMKLFVIWWLWLGSQTNQCHINRRFANMGLPSSNELDGFSTINHPATGVPPFIETPIYWCVLIVEFLLVISLWEFKSLQRHGAPNEYNVRPPRYLSWFITPITMVYGTYNYSYWGL